MVHPGSDLQGAKDHHPRQRQEDRRVDRPEAPLQERPFRPSGTRPRFGGEVPQDRGEGDACRRVRSAMPDESNPSPPRPALPPATLPPGLASEQATAALSPQVQDLPRSFGRYSLLKQLGRGG